MKSLLENGHSWILENLFYKDGILYIDLRELVKGKETVLEIGENKIDGVKPLISSKDSMIVRMSFDWCLSWQCINESACSGFGSEVVDSSGFLSVLSESKYLTYTLDNHGWYQDVQGEKARHYRIWSENEIIDVISFGTPEMEQLNA
jgi:hypothetical protein